MQKVDTKRRKIILLLKLAIFFCIAIFYYLFFKLSIYLVNFNLYTQHKEIFWVIDRIEKNMEVYNETKSEIEYADNMVEKMKWKNVLIKLEKEEEAWITWVQGMIENSMILYWFFCNSIKKDYPNVFDKYYEDKCNDEHFMRMIIKRILNRE